MSKDFLGWADWRRGVEKRLVYRFEQDNRQGQAGELIKSREQIYPNCVPTFFQFSVFFSTSLVAD